MEAEIQCLKARLTLLENENKSLKLVIEQKQNFSAQETFMNNLYTQFKEILKCPVPVQLDDQLIKKVGPASQD